MREREKKRHKTKGKKNPLNLERIHTAGPHIYMYIHLCTVKKVSAPALFLFILTFAHRLAATDRCHHRKREVRSARKENCRKNASRYRTYIYGWKEEEENWRGEKVARRDANPTYKVWQSGGEVRLEKIGAAFYRAFSVERGEGFEDCKIAAFILVLGGWRGREQMLFLGDKELQFSLIRIWKS